MGFRYAETPYLNDVLEQLGYEAEQAERYAMAGVSYDAKRGGWVLMLVRPDGRVEFTDYLERRKARQALQNVAGMVLTSVQDKKWQRPRPLVHPTNRKPVRPPIPIDLRWAVLERDGHRCTYCGSPSPERTLQVDHIVPFSKGGPTTAENLTTACRDCNLGKRDKELVR